MDDSLSDLLSAFASGVEGTAAKVAKRLVEIGELKDAGDILRRAELLSTTIEAVARRSRLRAELPGDE